MRIIKGNLAAGIVAATGAMLAGQQAMAQTEGGTALRVEGFAGVARDERALDGRDKGQFSGGALPSVGFDMGGVAKVQVDGMVASHMKDTVFAGAGHVGLNVGQGVSIGAYASYAHFDATPRLDTYRIGGELVAHMERTTIAAVMGYEHSQRRSATVGVIDEDTVIDSYGRGGSFFSMADVTYYPNSNWSLTAGHRYVGRRHAAAIGTEKAFEGSGFSVFAEGRIDGGSYAAGWAGVRIRFGRSGPSLQASDQSGFTNRLKDDLFVPANTRGRTLVAPPAPPPPPEGGEGGCCGACYAQ